MSWFLHTIPEWLEVVALAACIGGVACRFMLLDGPDFGIRRLTGYGLAVLAVGSVTDLLVRASEMSGRPILAVWPMLSTVAFHTHLGQVMLVRIAAIALAVAAFKATTRDDAPRLPLFFMAGLLAIVSMTESATGHAADSGDFSLAEAMDWLHLSAVSVWGGGLLVLFATVLPGLAKAGGEAAPVTAAVARRFSSVAGMAVGVVLVTSLYNGWIYVGGFAAFPATPYGRLLIAKIGLFGLLLGLGAYNRYVSVPRLQLFDGPGPVGPDWQSAVSRFRVRVGAEAALVLVVLLLATALRHEVPALHYTPPGSPSCPGCTEECNHH